MKPQGEEAAGMPAPVIIGFARRRGISSTTSIEINVHKATTSPPPLVSLLHFIQHGVRPESKSLRIAPFFSVDLSIMSFGFCVLAIER